MKKLQGVIATGFFRTGSTFLFSSLREVESLKCFYEPYHPEILDYVKSSKQGETSADKGFLGHTVEGDYFSEYRDVDIEAMSRALNLESRTTNHPVLSANCQHNDLKNYIDFLMHEARVEKKKPLLQANRFNFCLPWIKKNYPEYLTVLIIREPYAIFKSLQGLAKKENKELDPFSKNEPYWNVEEIYQNLKAYYNVNLEIEPVYYQKLYLILKLINLEGFRYADTVISYEQFIESEGRPVIELLNAIGAESKKSEAFIKSNSAELKASTKPKEIKALEEAVDLSQLPQYIF